MTSPAPGSICLSMIVRDEAEVVTTALECVAPHIDHWIVVDTGSRDGTVDAVEGFFAAAGIPGGLHRRQWRDFGHNRTEALDLCRGQAEYAWVIDADDRVVGTPPLDHLDADCYRLRYGPDPAYWREQVFRLSLGWRYEGPVHEYATSAEPCRAIRLVGDYHVESRRLGARGRAPDTYERDARLLLAALEREPGHPRWTFYLAQSLFDAGDHRAALEWYSRRSELGGWEEEIFYSLLRRAACLHLLGARWEEIERAYRHCWRSRRHRAEPLLEIARGRRRRDDVEGAYGVARQARDLPFPEEDDLFVAADVYEWRSADELAYCALRTGRIAESADAWDAALRSGAAPAREQERMARNLAFAKALIAHRGAT